MIDINTYITNFSSKYAIFNNLDPWDLTHALEEHIEKIITTLDHNYIIKNGIAIHKTAIIEANVTFKGPIIIMENCFIGANAYFRAGVLLDSSVKIGASCEIKSSLICSNTSIAHLSYIGNSVIGQYVNFEAGSIAANHYNERSNKKILVKFNNKIIMTNTIKFGALVGDNSKIGANAVLSPGTLLGKNSIVNRLELVNQMHKTKTN